MYVDTIIAGMKNMRKITKRRAVSPVIATVILVAVTITVAVAVSYWMSGISSQYTSFEKVEIQTAICTYKGTDNYYWEIVIKLKNSGTKTATLTNVFLNEGEAEYKSQFTTGTPIQADLGPSNTKKILSGDTETVTVWIEDDAGTILSSGTTVNIKLHSAGGMDYIRLVSLV